MKLMIVTQKVDKEDENLGAFYYWFDLFAKKYDELVIIADSVGTVDFPKNVTICEMGKGRGYRTFHRLWNLWRFFRVNWSNTDAVLFHQIPEFVIAASPFLFFSKKRIALWYAHKSVTTRLRIAEKLVDYVFTSSAAGFRLPSKKVFYVGQAINTDLFRPLQGFSASARGGSLRMVTIGRIAPIKNYEIIVKACSLLKEKFGVQWSLSIVGGPIMQRDRDYYESLKKLVLENGLSTQIHFFGARPYSEVSQILQEHDMFINVSATGSLDKAVFEAMSCGLTVITANEAYREIVPAQYFLLHVKPDFLAERIKTLAGEGRPNSILRQIVLEHHSLSLTLERMYEILTSPDYVTK